MVAVGGRTSGGEGHLLGLPVPPHYLGAEHPAEEINLPVEGSLGSEEHGADRAQLGMRPRPIHPAGERGDGRGVTPDGDGPEVDQVPQYRLESVVIEMKRRDGQVVVGGLVEHGPLREAPAQGRASEGDLGIGQADAGGTPGVGDVGPLAEERRHGHLDHQGAPAGTPGGDVATRHPPVGEAGGAEPHIVFGQDGQVLPPVGGERRILLVGGQTASGGAQQLERPCLLPGLDLVGAPGAHPVETGQPGGHQWAAHR